MRLNGGKTTMFSFHFPYSFRELPKYKNQLDKTELNWEI